MQVRGTPSAKSSMTGDPIANTSCPFMHWWWPCTCRKSPAEVKKNHRQPCRMEASIWPCQTSDKSSEVWDMVSTWRGYERKTVEYLTKDRRTSVDRFCDRQEVKPNRKFDSVRGLVNPNFRTVRPHFSIQFSTSSPGIVRNRRIEPKFGLLNLSNDSPKNTLYTSTMKTQETKNDTWPNAKDKTWQIHEVKSKQYNIMNSQMNWQKKRNKEWQKFLWSYPVCAGVLRFFSSSSTSRRF